VTLPLLHARWAGERRERQAPAIAAVARGMPAADLALSGAARHLRFPSLEEPGAAFADVPAGPDIDPGGAALAPPVELYARTANWTHVERAAARPSRTP
jgi:hypothetical protein